MFMTFSDLLWLSLILQELAWWKEIKICIVLLYYWLFDFIIALIAIKFKAILWKNTEEKSGFWKQKKGTVAKHFVLFLPWWKIKKNAWKASSMVTPLFRAGDEASMIRKSRLEDGTWGTVAIKAGSVFQTSAVLQTDGLPRPPPPALKGGVTANVAPRAGRGFATAPFFVIDR